MTPGRSLVHGLPDVGLKRRHALAAGQVAQVHRVGLVGGQAVVAAVLVGGRDLGPARAAVRRPIRDGAAAGRRVVELSEAVGDDRRLAAVRADVGEAVSRHDGAEHRNRSTDGDRNDGSQAHDSQHASS